MKNIYLLIKTILLATVICIPQINKAQALDIEMEDSYESTFTTRSLSNYQIKGFEKRALQKVKDLADYLSIVANKEYDEKLRKQARGMIIEQFMEESATITGIVSEISDLGTLKLKQYLDSYFSNKYSRIEVKYTQVKYLNAFIPNETGNYKGKIYLKQENNYYQKEEHVGSSYLFRHIDVYLVKVKKKFGNKKENIWKVYLGSLEAVKH